jgi:hypothetical protein
MAIVATVANKSQKKYTEFSLMTMSVIRLDSRGDTSAGLWKAHPKINAIKMAK